MTDAQELEKLQREQDVRAVMGTPEGRRFVWRLLLDAGVFAPTFSTEALVSAYRQGRREQALDLMAELMATAPEQFSLMQQRGLAAVVPRSADSADHDH